MSLIASSYYAGLRATGVPMLRRKLQNAGLILCYHNVVEAPTREVRLKADTTYDSGCPGLHETRDRFERQMRWLKARYDLVSLRDFTEQLTRGASMRSVAAVTFDDGYEGVFEYAVPVLQWLGIPATIFIVTEAVGSFAPFPWDGAAAYRPADWDRIRAAVGGGIEVGVHSATHLSLPSLTDGQLQREIVASRATIRASLGAWPQFFAYPFGHWSARVREVVRLAGYGGAVTLDFGLNRRSADRWALRRINVPAGISDAAFEAWTSGCHGLTT